MPLRHEIHQLILAGFREHGIDLPFPPFQMRLESLDGKRTARTLTSAGKGNRPAGSVSLMAYRGYDSLSQGDDQRHQIVPRRSRIGEAEIRRDRR
jgi:hypothetical protein